LVGAVRTETAADNCVARVRVGGFQRARLAAVEQRERLKYRDRVYEIVAYHVTGSWRRVDY